MKLTLPFKTWTRRAVTHMTLAIFAIAIAQPAQALSFRVNFNASIAEQCAAQPTWAEAQSCVGAAMKACYENGKHWTDGRFSIRGLVLSDCAGREVSFWDKTFEAAYAQKHSQSAASAMPWDDVRRERNRACWRSSKPTMAQFMRLTRPHLHMADCALPQAAKQYFDLKAQN